MGRSVFAGLLAEPSDSDGLFAGLPEPLAAPAINWEARPPLPAGVQSALTAAVLRRVDCASAIMIHVPAECWPTAVAQIPESAQAAVRTHLRDMDYRRRIAAAVRAAPEFRAMRDTDKPLPAAVIRRLRQIPN